MAVRKDSALYKLLVAMKVELDDDLRLTSIGDVEIEDGELFVAYEYSQKDPYNSDERFDNDDVATLALFDGDGGEGFCCGAREIGNFANFSPNIVIPQVVAAMKSYLMGTKLGLITATTYNQPGAEKLLKASGFESKPFYNPGTRHTCMLWTWRRTR